MCIEETKKELPEGGRPELKKYLDSVDSYDTTFVGYSSLMGSTWHRQAKMEYGIQVCRKVFCWFC